MENDLTAIWRNFDRSLARFVRARVRDPDVVEDIVQEVYLKIHLSLDRLRDPDRIEGWIYRIARNAVVDYYRRRRPSAELSEALQGSEEDRDAKELELRIGRDVRAMVEKLPPIYREAITLTDLGASSQVELARRLGLSFSGAKSRVQRARALLREMLLRCCHFQFDRLGRVIDYHPRCQVCCAGHA